MSPGIKVDIFVLTSIPISFFNVDYLIVRFIFYFHLFHCFRYKSMNDTYTTISPDSTTTITYGWDAIYLFFVNPLIITRIYQIGYPITLIVGIFGNIASLLTFSRPTLRKISTGFLFIFLAASDTFVLLTYFIDFLEFGLKVIALLLPLINNIVFPFFSTRFVSIHTFDTISFVNFVRLYRMSHRCSLLGFW